MLRKLNIYLAVDQKLILMCVQNQATRARTRANARQRCSKPRPSLDSILPEQGRLPCLYPSLSQTAKHRILGSGPELQPGGSLLIKRNVCILPPNNHHPLCGFLLGNSFVLCFSFFFSCRPRLPEYNTTPLDLQPFCITIIVGIGAFGQWLDGWSSISRRF